MIDTHTLVLMSVLMSGSLNVLRTPQSTDPADSPIGAAEPTSEFHFPLNRTPTSTRIFSRTQHSGYAHVGVDECINGRLLEHAEDSAVHGSR